ncbi:Hypothetical predicted protein [Octopus vulgaris]|uniref:Uncharacterized protein n=1 Tax=Octopus vulgaris TaxID=6645 RepID=A0AA36BLQ2_OCTVU|nr:Hypothetical predicted protein [Octopus vulgaris]
MKEEENEKKEKKEEEEEKKKWVRVHSFFFIITLANTEGTECCIGELGFVVAFGRSSRDVVVGGGGDGDGSGCGGGDVGCGEHYDEYRQFYVISVTIIGPQSSVVEWIVSIRLHTKKLYHNINH